MRTHYPRHLQQQYSGEQQLTPRFGVPALKHHEASELCAQQCADATRRTPRVRVPLLVVSKVIFVGKT